MAGAAKITVAEVPTFFILRKNDNLSYIKVEELLPEGQYLDGTDVHVPGIFVDRVVKGT